MSLHRAFVFSSMALFAHAALGDCDHRASRSGEVDATGVRKVVVSAAAGDLVVSGDMNSKTVRATGEACAESQAELESVRLEVRRDGDTAFVRAIMPERDSFMRNTSLDMKVEVPSDVALELEDSSGDLKVERVASARIDDSSGDQVIREIAGDVTVNDSSGEIEIDAVRGNVSVRDSSGEIEIADVGGDVTIPVDSSGDISLKSIRGGVHILTDSSGDISVAEINKNVRIDNDSSGSIRVSDVGGDFTVGHDSTGNISHRNVLGKVSTPRESD